MGEYIIESKNLSFSYSKDRKDISGLNLRMPKNSIYGFLGRNGSGKTTTIRLILGLLKATSGELKLFNDSLSNNRIGILKQIGALIEDPSLYGNLTGYENLSIIAKYRRIYNKSKIYDVLNLVGLGNVGNKRVSQYSLGMKQRLGLAICLLDNPQLLILDEPTNGLDPEGIHDMRELLKFLNNDLGISIFISSHLLFEIEKLCSHIGIIHKGQMLFQGTAHEFESRYFSSLSVFLDVDDKERAITVLNNFGFAIASSPQVGLSLSIDHKEDASFINALLVKSGIKVFEIKFKEGFEEVFLSLTSN